MDPYIETPRLWPDFHSDLAGEARAQLNQLIQPDYVALLTPYVVYERIELSRSPGIRPDVGVYDIAPGAPRGGVAVATIAPAVVTSAFPVEAPLTLHRIEVRRVEGDVLVTVIE